VISARALKNGGFFFAKMKNEKFREESQMERKLSVKKFPKISVYLGRLSSFLEIPEKFVQVAPFSQVKL